MVLFWLTAVSFIYSCVLNVASAMLFYFSPKRDIRVCVCVCVYVEGKKYLNGCLFRQLFPY